MHNSRQNDEDLMVSHFNQIFKDVKSTYSNDDVKNLITKKIDTKVSNVRTLGNTFVKVWCPPGFIFEFFQNIGPSKISHQKV
jgi:hypothetical protein